MLKSTYDVALSRRSLGITTRRPISESSLGVPDLGGQIERAGEYPAAQGAHAEIWLGEWVRTAAGQKVGGAMCLVADFSDLSSGIGEDFAYI